MESKEKLFSKEYAEEKIKTRKEDIMGKSYIDLKTNISFKVINLVSRTKNINQPENWNVFIVTDKALEANEKLGLEKNNYLEYPLSYFDINCVE
ncbi:MAG: hypothetical protein ABI388_07195 [Bacteroidia bacterium]